jgi:hypothetical protein
MEIRHKGKISSITLIAILLLMGCKVYKPEMPLESYKYQLPKPQNSVINLFADLEVAKLEAIVNSKIDSVLYDDHSFDDHDSDNLMLKAWKDGQVTLKFEKDELVWELPLRIWMKKGLKVFNYNVPFVDSWEYTGNIKLRFKTKLTVNHDWSIKTVTITDGYEWVKKPAVKIGSVNIPITIIANILLSANKETISNRIDDTMAGSFNFRQIAEEGWKMMFNPYKIQGDYDAWLSINPYSISLMPIEGSLGHIRFGAAVVSDVECLLDNVPQAGQIRTLPDLQPLKASSDTFHISLLTDIPYTSISRLITAECGDSTFAFGNRKITFESFRVYGSNGKLAVETKVRGTIKGTIYLIGTPYFNAADTTVRIKDLAFDMRTKSFLTNTAKWLFNGKIERTLMKSIAIPFNTNISKVESQLAGFLKHYPLGYGFELNGKLARLSVTDLALTPGSIKANILFSGHLSLGMSEIVLSKNTK